MENVGAHSAAVIAAQIVFVILLVIDDRVDDYSALIPRRSVRIRSHIGVQAVGIGFAGHQIIAFLTVGVIIGRALDPAFHRRALLNVLGHDGVALGLQIFRASRFDRIVVPDIELLILVPVSAVKIVVADIIAQLVLIGGQPVHSADVHAVRFAVLGESDAAVAAVLLTKIRRKEDLFGQGLENIFISCLEFLLGQDDALVAVLVSVCRVGHIDIEGGIEVVFCNTITVLNAVFTVILQVCDRVDTVGIGLGLDALAVIGLCVCVVDPDGVDLFGDDRCVELGLCLGDRSAACGDGGGGIGRPDPHDVLRSLIARVLSGVQMDGDGVGDIEVHQAIAVAVEVHSFLVPLFVHGQRAVADDAQARAVITEIVAHPDMTQLALAHDTQLEVIAHEVDGQFVVRQLDVVDGQGIGLLVVGRARERLVVGDDR